MQRAIDLLNGNVSFRKWYAPDHVRVNPLVYGRRRIERVAVANRARNHRNTVNRTMHNYNNEVD